MKSARQGLLFVVLLLAAGTLHAAEVVVDASLRDVLVEMGQPRGYIRSGSYLLLDYERGKVELRDEVVVRADLMTDEEFVAYRDRTAKRDAAASKAAAARRAALLAEGTRIRDAKLIDPVFLASSASEQVAYWRWFRQKYPGVDVGGEYAVVLQKYEAELAQQSREADRKREIAALEVRVAGAERAAAEAQQEAEQARAYRYYATYPVCYVKPVIPCGPVIPQPLPVVIPRHRATLTWGIGPGPQVVPPAATYGSTIGWLAWER